MAISLRLLRAGMIALAVAALPVQPAFSQQQAAQPARIAIDDLTGPQAGALIRQLVAAGRHADARALAKAWRAGDSEHRVRIAFTEGLIAAQSGDHRAAVGWYRQILAGDPDNDMVRLALAQSLAALNDVDGVRAQTRHLVEAGIDDRLGGAVTRLLERVEAARPFQFRGHAAILPSTNINSGTDRETVALGAIDLTIDPASRRKSGIGLMAGGEASYRHRLTGPWMSLTTASVTGRFYPSIDHSQFVLGGTTGLVGRFSRQQVSLALTAGADITNGALIRTRIGVQGEFQRRFDERWTGYVSPYLRFTDDRVNDGRDGWTGGVQAFADRHFGRNHFVRFLAGFETAALSVERFSYTEAKAGIGYNREWGLGINAYLQADVALRRHDALYPGLAEAQRDTRIGLQAVFTKRDFTIAGLAPQLAYRFERNISNAAFDDRTTHEFDIRLTKDF